MANTNKEKLTAGQISFIEYWKEVVIPNKRSITSDMLSKASSYIGYSRSGTCSSCMRNDATELNNRYRGLLPVYEEYLKQKNTTTTTTEYEEIPMNEVLPDEETTSTTTTTKKKRVVKKSSTRKKK